MVDHLARAAALGARLRHLEKAARAEHLSAAAAGRTADGARSRLSAGAFAFLAGVELRDFDLLFTPGSRILEADLHVVAQVGPLLPPIAVRAGAAGHAAEDVLEDSAAGTGATAARAKDFAEYVEWIVKATARAGIPLGKRLMAIAVVCGALVFIHEDVIRLAQLLEPILGGVIARIFVRMIFHRQLAVGPLDFVPGRIAGNLENLVVVALDHYSAGLPDPLETITLAGRMRRSLSLNPLRICRMTTPSATSALSSCASAS